MGLLRRQRARADGNVIELYYASDIHGSDVLWRKFLNARKYYGVDALIMGGDLVGKAVVPIAEAGGEYRARFLGEDRTAKTRDELEALVAAIRFNGFYSWVSSPEEIVKHNQSAPAQAELFDRLVATDVADWVRLADERANGSGRHAFVIAGNDDPWFVDDILRGSTSLVMCDDQIVRVGDHEMVSLSYANPTPWKSERELSENDLYERIKRLASQLDQPERAILNLHVPPYDSTLDRAVKINDDLTPVYDGGVPLEVPVGSTAVRQIIEEYQPLLALHGHIHESRGDVRIGRTLAINSGSEYNSGRLHGVTVKLGTDSVVSHQFVVG